MSGTVTWPTCPCTVCGQGRVVVIFYMASGGRLAYCRHCWFEVWGYTE